MVASRIALGVEYDGAAFCGWQTQPSRCAVQDHLEAALAHIAGEAVESTCAGRTDAGVHALEQVIHFDSAAARPISAWVRGVNASLPAGIAVLWAQEVGDDFHARFSARSRCYRYVLLNHPVRPAIGHGSVGWFHLPLDVERMRAAAARLEGEHDFSSFRSSECQAKSPVRHVTSIAIERRGAYVIFEFRANAFLHHMVRNFMGTLIAVGKGRYEPAWVTEVMDARDRTVAAPTFDAAGLYLARVEYAAQWQLPQARMLVPPLADLVQP